MEASCSNKYRHIPGGDGYIIQPARLVSVLHDCKWDEAERMIHKLGNAANFLNQAAGSDDVTPIALVLCSMFCYKKRQMNLKLAMLLVERGADPNLCLSYPVRPPMEENSITVLVRKYLTIKCRIISEGRSNDSRSGNRRQIVNDVGLDGLRTTDPRLFLSQILTLLRFFFDRGGRPDSCVDCEGRTILFEALASPYSDLDLIRMLLKAGANVNLTDLRGRTPLMELMRRNECPRRATLFMKYILHEKYTMIPDLHKKDKAGRSVLAESVASENIEVTLELGKHGAMDISSSFCWPFIRKDDASTDNDLVAWEMFTLATEDTLNLRSRPKQLIERLQESYRKVCTSRNVVSALVDAGYGIEHITEDISYWMEHTTMFQRLGMLGAVPGRRSLVQLMFGKMSAGLKQLCIRAIMKVVYLAPGREEVLPKQRDSFRKPDICQEILGLSLTTDRLVRMVTVDLGLPRSFVVYFEIEAAKWQLYVPSDSDMTAMRGGSREHYDEHWLDDYDFGLIPLVPHDCDSDTDDYNDM